MSETNTWRDQNEYRYELSRGMTEQVLGVLARNIPVVRYKDSPPTSLVATLYFDTSTGHYLKRARAGGKVSSIKVRAREYMPVSEDEARCVLAVSEHCYLERKERLGKVRQKFRIKIPKSELNGIVQGQIPLSEESTELQRELSGQVLVPTLLSMYERRVWGNDDLRITLDERIRYYSPPPLVYQENSAMQPDELGAPHALGPKRILEVKGPRSIPFPNWLQKLLNNLPEAAGFSKFLDGMAKLGKSEGRATSLTRPVFPNQSLDRD